jgi:hypothetical protein
MKYTREKGVLRILVGCLDFRRIPAKERIFMADGFYDISFEVEVQRDLVMTTEVNLGEDHSDNDGHGNNGDSVSDTQKTSMPWRLTLLITAKIRKALKMRPRMALTSTSWPEISPPGSNSLLESNI